MKGGGSLNRILLFFSILLLSSHAFAFDICVKNGAECKWPANQVTFHINDSECISSSEWSIWHAMQTWNAAPTSGFAFVYGGLTDKNDFGDEEKIHIVQCGSLADQGEHADSVALTTKWLKSTGEILDSDIIINTATYYFSTDAEEDTYDIESIALHELGHTFGLKDLYDSASKDMVMYGYGVKGEERRSLTYDDMDGITYLYPFSNCGATFSITDEVLYFPAVMLGNDLFWLDLNYWGTSAGTEWYWIKDFGMVTDAGKFQGCQPPAITPDLRLTVPALYYEGWSYWAVMEYVPTDDGKIWVAIPESDLGSNW